MLTSSAGKPFKPAPPKFVKELSEADDLGPEPPFLRQLIAGERALRSRRRGELALASAAGGGVALFLASVAGLALTSLTWFVVALAVIFLVIVGVTARGFWYLWDAKMADVECRSLVAESESHIRILPDPVESEDSGGPYRQKTA
jgi:hypothetical protein